MSLVPGPSSFARQSNEATSSSTSLPSSTSIAALQRYLGLTNHLIVEKVAGVPRVFTSPTATGLPWLFDYDYEPPPPPYRGFLKTLFRPHWAHHRVHPGLAFTPLDIPYEGPIFGRLKFDTEDGRPLLEEFGMTFCGEYLITGYQLPSAYIRQWSRLEVAFDVIVYLLCKRPECRKAWSTGAYFDNLPRPHWYGYDRTHSTKAAAERAAYRSRHAFHALAGLCSYTIAMSSGDLNRPNPDWITHLQHWVHPGWLEDLRSSVVGRLDESVRRRGAVVDAQNCRWDEEVLMAMMESSVPIWIYWPSPNTEGYSILLLRKPDPVQVKEKLRLLRLTDSSTAHSSADIAPSVESQVTGSSSFTFHTTSSADTADTLPTTVDLDLNSVFPPVEPGSGQRRGQHWRSFFEDQERRHAHQHRNATDDKLRIWADRKRANEYGSAPGRGGAVVWEWVDVDGFFIRKRVERGRVEEAFYEYGRTQKRYNPIDREWDLHFEFDPTAVPDDDDDDETVYNESRPAAVDGLLKADIEQAFIDDITGSYGSIEGPLRVVELHCAPLLHILRNRYGLAFNGPSHNVLAPSDFKLLPEKKLKNVILRTDLPDDESIVLSMSLFIELISRRSFAMTEAPSLRCMWDLSRYSGNPVTMKHSPPFCRVWRIGDRKSDLFVVSGRDDRYLEWDMLLEHPLTLLECRRRFHNSTPKRDIILYFIRTGTPFIRVIDVINFNSDSFSVPRSLPPELLPGWRQPTFIADDQKNSLGCRCPEYKPNHADYISYWAKLVAFLRGPRGHLVAVMGGIVWRLAVQALGLEEVGRIVLAGGAYRSPTPIRYESRHHAHHFDELETLSSPELDFVVGTYYVYTDKGVQIAKQSWWPPHHTWRRGGRDMGHWTEAAEDWFNKRLDAIRADPGAALNTPKNWTNILKFDGKALWRFVDGSNQAAADFLSNGTFR